MKSNHRPATSMHQRNSSTPNLIQLIGYLGDPYYHQLKEISLQLNRVSQGKLNIEINEQQYEADYDLKVNQLKRSNTVFLPAVKLEKVKCGNSLLRQRRAYFLIDNKKPIFNINDLQKSVDQKIKSKDDLLNLANDVQKYAFETELQLKKCFEETMQVSYVYMDLKYGKGQPFKLVIELFKDYAPKTCKNFVQLCEGFVNQKNQLVCYQNTSFHRFVRNGFIQGGYINDNNSIYGGFFEDESFQIKHDRPGIIGMASQGFPHTNGAQFYITLGKVAAFDRKMVAFGRVVCGIKNLEKLNKIKEQSEFMKRDDLVIVSCGKYIYKQSVDINIQNEESQTQFQNFITSSEIPIQLNEDIEFKIFEERTNARNTVFCIRPNQIQQPQKEVLTMLEHLKIFSEKYNLCKEFNQLIIALSNAFKQTSQVLQNSYRIQSIDQLIEAIQEIIVQQLTDCESVALIYCIKNDQLIKIPSHQTGKYIIAFNPIDIDDIEDINCCGSSFIVFKKTSSSYRPPSKNDFLQLGDNIEAAGYCLYGPKTQIVYHAGFRVNIYTLNVKDNEFYLTHNRVKGGQKKGLISIQESDYDEFDRNMKIFLQRKKGDNYYCRYVGSIVADFHRTLLYGGLLLYPKLLDSAPQGQVNILQAYTFSYLIEKAQDKSSNGGDGSILQKKISSVNQQTPLYIGFGQEILEIENLYLAISRQQSVFSKINKHKFIVNQQQIII